MSMKDNFKQALHQIASKSDEDTNLDSSSESETDVVSKGEKRQEEPTVYKSAAVQSSGKEDAMTTGNNQNAMNTDKPDEDATEAGATVIMKGSQINGSISCMSEIIIYGDVIGNIDSESAITISGCIRGNIKGQSVKLTAAKVHGDFMADHAVVIGRESVIVGDILAESVEVSGKIKGNIETNGQVIIHADAYVLGDIKSHTIQIEQGSTIDGKVTVISPQNGTVSFSDHFPEISTS